MKKRWFLAILLTIALCVFFTGLVWVAETFPILIVGVVGAAVLIVAFMASYSILEDLDIGG